MNKLARPVSPEDHVAGPESARVTLVEYGDFECPHCGRAYPVVEEVQRRMGDSLRFAFRHFPLSQVHEHAEMAAEAAEAATAEGKFWEMHGLLFTHQDALGRADLARYASAIGIDVRGFEQALAAKTFRERVQQDFMSGVRSGVNGTPTFFINGVRYDGSIDLPELLDAVETGGTRARAARRRY